MSNPDVLWQRMTLAVGCMATQAGPLADRLEQASLELLGLVAEDFPEELRPRFVELIGQLTDLRAGGETVAIPPPADRVAEGIFALYVRVQMLHRS